MSHLATLARRARHPVVATLAVFALAWAMLELVHTAPVLHGDTHEDLLDARECLEQGRCSTQGARTTMSSIHQGALWINLLAGLRGAGLSVDAIHSITLALAAAAVALVFVVVERWSPRLAVATAALSTLGLVYGDTVHVPWNPSLTPLPAALLFALCAVHAERGAGWSAVPIGAALGLTLETHPVAVLAVPGALFVAGVATERRVTAALSPVVTASVALGFYAGMSPMTALGNADAAVTALGVAAVVPVVAIVGLAAALRGRFEALSMRGRRVVVGLALTLPVGLALIVMWAVADDPPIGGRYVAPALFAVAYLLAEALTPVLRLRGATAALGAGAVAAALSGIRVGDSRRTLPAIEQARVLLQQEDGMSLDDALARISGPACHDVIGGLAAAGMPIRGPADPRPREALVVALAGEALDAGDATVADLGRGRWRVVQGAGDALLVGELDTWVDRRTFSACIHTADPDAEPTCIERDLTEGVEALLGVDGFPLSRLAYPSVEWRDDSAEGAARNARRVIYRLPVHVPSGEARRTIFAPEVGRSCRTRFIEAEGVRVASPLPAESVVLAGDASDRDGWITVEVDQHGCDGQSLEVFPPCLSEVASEDSDALRRLLER